MPVWSLSQQGACVSAFWDTWRKEIIRGTALFCAVLVIGFAVHAAHRAVHEKVMNLPVALRDLRDEFARDDGGPGRSTAATWTYRSKLRANKWVWIRNTRGSVTVEPAKGDSLQVSAVKTYRSSDTASGDVDVVTAKGAVKAESVNGDVRVRVEAFGDTGGVSATTINGSVNAELPAQLDANVEAKTVNGSISTDYPLTVNGKFAGRNIKGTLGRGGREVRLETVNGSI